MVVVKPGTRARTLVSMWVWNDRNEYVGEVHPGDVLEFLTHLGYDRPQWPGISTTITGMYSKMTCGSLTGWVAPTDLEEIEEENGEKSVGDVVE